MPSPDERDRGIELSSGLTRVAIGGAVVLSAGFGVLIGLAQPAKARGNAAAPRTPVSSGTQSPLPATSPPAFDDGTGSQSQVDPNNGYALTPPQQPPSPATGGGGFSGGGTSSGSGFSGGGSSGGGGFSGGGGGVVSGQS